MKKAWPVIRRGLAICFLLASIFALGIAFSLRSKVEPPAAFLANDTVQVVYMRNIPYPGKRDAVVVAYTFEGEISDVTDRAELELRNWTAGRRGPLDATFYRGGPTNFEVLRIVPGQLIRSEDGTVPDVHTGKGFVTVFYGRAKNTTQAIAGALFGGIIARSAGSDSQYILVRPSGQGYSGGGGGQGRMFWQVAGAKEERNRYLLRIEF